MVKSFLKLAISFMLVGLIVYGLVSFGYKLQSENSVNDSILDHPMLSNTFGNLSTSLDTQESESEDQRKAFEVDEKSTGLGFFMLDGIISGGKAFTDILMVTYNLVVNSPLITDNLGVSKIVISAMTSILFLSVIFLLWRTYKAGG